jgi:hypothetical protein
MTSVTQESFTAHGRLAGTNDFITLAFHPKSRPPGMQQTASSEGVSHQSMVTQKISLALIHFL